MDENDFKRLAQQLRKPSGEDGVNTGEMMFKTNGSMIRRSIDLLAVADGDYILEIGYGNGAHLDYLFQKASNLNYSGIDISETMQKEASQHNQERVKAGVAEFLLGDGIKVPLADSIADKLFTVNTVYFWEDHPAVLQEIKRVLKPGGTLCIALASQNFMEKLPFAKNGFQLFHPEKIKELVEKEGLTLTQLLVEKEMITTKLMEVKEREVIYVLAKKPV